MLAYLNELEVLIFSSYLSQNKHFPPPLRTINAKLPMMDDLSQEEKTKLVELTEFALTPIEGKVTRIGSPSVIKMVTQMGDGPQIETQRKVFAISIKSSLGEDHLLFSNGNGIWNGVRNMCQDLAYTNKTSAKDRDAIVSVLWSEEFSAKNS